MISRRFWTKYPQSIMHGDIFVGYNFGMYNSGGGRESMIMKYNCVVDSCMDSGADCPSQEAWGSATRCPRGYIYWQEGYNGGNSDDQNAMALATLTVRSNLFDTGYATYQRAAGYTDNFAYYAGGRSSAGVEYSQVNRVHFATETREGGWDGLTQDLTHGIGASTHMKHYVFGGVNDSNASEDDIEAMSFAVQTYAQIGSDLTAVIGSGSAGISKTYIYVDSSATENKMSPATETPISITSSGNGTIYGSFGNDLYMYKGCGDDGSIHDDMYKMAFATETWQELTNVMTGNYENAHWIGG